MVNKKGGVILGFVLLIGLSVGITVISWVNDISCANKVRDPSWAEQQKEQCEFTDYVVQLIKNIIESRM